MHNIELQNVPELIGLNLNSSHFVIDRIFSLRSEPILSYNNYNKLEEIDIPITKDEWLYIRDSLEDYAEGRSYTSPAEESFEDFLKRLEE